MADLGAIGTEADGFDVVLGKSISGTVLGFSGSGAVRKLFLIDRDHGHLIDAGFSDATTGDYTLPTWVTDPDAVGVVIALDADASTFDDKILGKVVPL